MVRGIRVSAALLVALTAPLGATQQADPKSFVPPLDMGGGPALTITSPTMAGSIVVDTPKLILMGSAAGQFSSPVSTVTWRNDRGGAGIASYNPATRVWMTTGPGHGTTVIREAFSERSAWTDALRTGPLSTGWDEVVNTLPSKIAFLRSGGGYEPITLPSVNSGTSFIINTVDAFSDLSERSYDVSVTLADASSDAGDAAALIFGYEDDANYCAVFWNGAGAATDLYLLKRSQGTLSVLGEPSNIDPAADDTLTIEVRGEVLDVKVNGVSRITAVDSDCDNADRVGLGVGQQRTLAGAWKFEDFTVAHHDPGVEGIPLQMGKNVITVTATDTKGRAGSDTIVVTLRDTRAPDVGFRAPTTGASHSTSAATVDLAVATTDSAAVTSCSFACTTCTPKSGPLNRASLTGTAWSAARVALSAGVNTVHATCSDAAGNQGRASVVITRSVTDSVKPTLTLPANFTSATPSTWINGTARDNVSVTRLSWTCDRCPAGTAAITGGPRVAWGANVTLVAGANVLTFTAEDAAGNKTKTRITIYGPNEAPRKSVTLIWDWTGPPTARFKLWCNNSVVKNFNEADLTRKAMGGGVTEIRATVTGLKGVLECSLSAHDTVRGKPADSDRSNAITLNMELPLSAVKK
jgi:hypothetical protein